VRARPHFLNKQYKEGPSMTGHRITRSRIAPACRPFLPVAFAASLGPFYAQAQVGAQVVAASDEEVVRSWQQANPGGPTPVLQQDGDDTRLVWTGGVAADAYNNRVKSGSGNIGTPNTSGTFGKANLRGDLRATHASDSSVDFLHFDTMHSDDPAVLPRSRYQVVNVQAGRTAKAYSIAGGDVAPNFSALSSALGVRGVLGQAQMNTALVTGFTGEVAESWEALTHPSLRTQPVRTVSGAKLDVPVMEKLRGFVTAQQYDERRNTNLVAGQVAQPDAHSANATAGFQYVGERLTLSAEAGSSRLDDDVIGDRSARAAVIDGTLALGSGALRFGAHKLGAGYTSLSIAARPGMQEAYLAGDLAAFPWMTLGGDIRRTRNTTLATSVSAAVTSDTDSGALNANINFGPEWPGWTLALQQGISNSEAPQNQRQSNRQSRAGVNYAAPVWTANLTRTRDEVENSGNPTADSTTDGWVWALRRAFGAPQPGEWAGGAGVTGKSQIQRIVSGVRSESDDVAVQAGAERAGWGGFNVGAALGRLSPAQGQQPVRTRAYQADLTMQLRPQAHVKFYARYATRDGADPLQELSERTIGMQLGASF
jgi:hypothetical protein